MLFMGDSFFLGRRFGFEASGAIKADPVDRNIPNHRPVNVGVVNDRRIHMPNGGVTEKSATFPSAPNETGSKITEPIVNTTVEAEMKPPIPGIPTVMSSYEAPVTWRPKISRLRC